MGTEQTLHLDDFVLSKTQSSAQFVVERNGGLMDVDSLGSTVSETVTALDCTQELEMITRFSDIAISGRLDDFWPRVAMATQRVVDGAMASAKRDGALIELPPWGE